MKKGGGMVGKTLPGFAIALALGLLFCFSGGDKENRDSRRDGRVWVQRASATATAPGESIFRLTRARPAHATQEPAAGDAVFGRDAILAMRPPAPSPATESATTPPTRMRFADAAPPAARKTPPPHSYGLTSGTALASLSGRTSPALPAAHTRSFAYPALPPKGIAIWGKGMTYREMKDAANPFENAYSHDGTVYSLGAAYDWSVDSTIGASVDCLQAELTGKHPNESRRTDTVGYFVNAHYNGALGGKVPFRARAMYGWLEQDASGWAEDWHTWTRFPWNEEKHSSRMFGFSASVIYPMLYSDIFRITPEIGFDYRNLRTKEYDVGITLDNSVRLRYPSMISTSHSSYVSTAISRDFRQVWGVVTPRLSCGYSVESSDTAGGVRALHASAASPAAMDAIAMSAAAPRFDIGPKRLWTYNLGLDMKILGGWDVSAEYGKKTGKEYDRDSFKLEIRRCF